MPRTRLTEDQILSILEETPPRLAAVTRGVTEEELHSAPEPGEWSVNENLAHLRACADVWGDAIETILVSDRPTLRAVNPTTWIKSTDYPKLAFAPSLGAFKNQRSSLLALLQELPGADWSRSATVVGGGSPLELTVHSYANRLARHERSHWRQVAKTLNALRPR